MYGYGGCCCRPVAPVVAPTPVFNGNVGIGIISIAVLILIALGVIF